MRQYLLKFSEYLDFPAEATASLLSAYDKITERAMINGVFTKWIKLYESGGMSNGKPYGQMLSEVGGAAKDCRINRYQAELLIFMCLSRGLKAQYDARGISENIYHDSMLDLRCKLFECHRMYGIWGSFVAGWFPGFFFLDRFALGRLQFEPIRAGFDYSDGSGRRVVRGDKVLNVHIPSLGKLPYDAVADSYDRASDFFGTDAFVCHSWLLFPENKSLLPEDSNILRFASDYHILSTNNQELPGDMWRVFYSGWSTDFSALPRDTCMQNAYADYLSAGNLPGEGHGVYIHTRKDKSRS